MSDFILSDEQRRILNNWDNSDLYLLIMKGSLKNVIGVFRIQEDAELIGRLLLAVQDEDYTRYEIVHNRDNEEYS